MRSHEALDETDFRRVEALCRDSEKLPVVIRSWYQSAKTGAPPIHPDGGAPRPADSVNAVMPGDQNTEQYYCTLAYANSVG